MTKLNEIFDENHEKKYFVMMIGCPASGKSTFTKNLGEQLGWDIPVISSDQEIVDLGVYHGLTYDEVWKNVDLRNEAMNNFKNNWNFYMNSSPEDMILDRTNMSKGARSKFLKEIKEKGEYTIIAVDCHVDEELHQKWLVRPGKSIPDYVIKDMKKSYDAPSFEEGFSTIITIENGSIEKILTSS